MIHRIAVPVNAGLVAANLNETSQVYFFDIENNAVVQEQMSVFPTEKDSVMPVFCAENSVNEIILGQPSEAEINTFLANRISVVMGAPVMNPRDVVEDYLFQMQHHQHGHGHGHGHGGGGCGCNSHDDDDDSDESCCNDDGGCGCH